MKVALLQEPMRFEIAEAERPRVSAGQILVRTLACGICEGDTHIFRGEFDGGKPTPWKRLIGHEGSGIVEEVGEEVVDFKVGDRVTLMGGRFSEYDAVDARIAAKIPPGIDPLWALGEPVACVVHAGWRFGIRLGDTVAVVGVGFMGLLCLQLARISGTARIFALDLLDWRLKRARELGADRTLNASGRTPEEISRELGEVDVVIEAAGVQPAIDIATSLVREHGRIVLVGYHLGGPRTVDVRMWNYKAIDVVNGHVRNDAEKLEAMKAGLRLMESGRLEVRSLVTPYSLSDIGRAFGDVIEKKPGVFKAVIAM
ncbi:MAG: zinc-binding dehydrogenase [bacterium]